jgi:hypothetical protein
VGTVRVDFYAAIGKVSDRDGCAQPSQVSFQDAVKTQIWTALIAMLILKHLQMKSSFAWSLSNLAALLRQQLFIFRDLWAWLNTPLDGPPAARQLCEQLPMPLMWQLRVGQQRKN